MNAKIKVTVVAVVIALLVLCIIAVTWYVKTKLTVYDKDGMTHAETTVGNTEGDE